LTNLNEDAPREIEIFESEIKNIFEIIYDNLIDVPDRLKDIDVELDFD